MKVIVPDYYKEFKCIADKCKHTCCKGWEIEIDDESLARFEKHPDICKHIEKSEDNHFALLEGECCPFLNVNGLCNMILEYGEDMICQTCADHPRFRNYWSNCIELGLGMVCEEAARIILSQEDKMELLILSDDGGKEELPEDEEWLMQIRDNLLKQVDEDGPIARLKEYLIYRHIADALYDDRLEERIAFVDYFVELVRSKWQETDESFEALIEVVRALSYDIEYDDEEKERILALCQ